MKNSLTLITAKTFLISSILYGVFMLVAYLTQIYLDQGLNNTPIWVLLVSVAISYYIIDFLTSITTKEECISNNHEDNLNSETYEF